MREAEIGFEKLPFQDMHQTLEQILGSLDTMKTIS